MLLFSFLIRYTRNVAAMSAVMTGLMVMTYFLQMRADLALLWSAIAIGCVAWVLIGSMLLKKAMLDLTVEEAWALYPMSALTSVALGWFLAMTIEADLRPEDGDGGLQHFTILIAGITVALFLLFRCTEIKFLPSMSEMRRD